MRFEVSSGRFVQVSVSVATVRGTENLLTYSSGRSVEGGNWRVRAVGPRRVDFLISVSPPVCRRPCGRLTLNILDSDTVNWKSMVLIGRLLFFAFCASMDPTLTARSDDSLCLEISAPLNTQIERVLFGFEVSCRPVQRLSFRRCARMTFKAQKPRPRSLPTPPPCAYPQTA